MISRAAFFLFYINPLFSNFSIMANSLFLDLCKLLLSFETAFWCRELICANFCSREYGCNNMDSTSFTAPILF